MKYLIPLLGAVVLSTAALAQDNKARFDALLTAGDTTAQRTLLQQWELEAPEDPELFTSYFNYHVRLAKDSYLGIVPEPPKGQSLTIEGEEGEPVGYLGEVTHYDPVLLLEAYEKIDQGIALHPDRLDMRFGKAYMLAETEEWDSFAAVLVAAIRRSVENNNAWLWTRNEAQGGGREGFLDLIQSYQGQLYETGDDSLLVHMRTIANEVLEHYPDHVESLSNVAITYLLTGNFAPAIEALQRALELAPTDGIVMGNLARAYYLNKEKDKAIGQYEQMLELDDPGAQEFARQQIEALKAE